MISVQPFNWKAFRQDHERRVIERAVRQKLKQKLIEAGYRALAVKMHPDLGGSTLDMVRLSEVRDEMIQQLGLKKPRHRARHVWTFEWMQSG